MTTASSTAWMARAACASRRDLPWLTDAPDVAPWAAEAMRAVCDSCPVLLDCVAAVDELDVTGGWWAGHDRDPHTYTVDTAPAWATTTPDVPVPGTRWVPVRTRSNRRHAGRVVAEQGCLALDLGAARDLGGAA